MIVNLLLATALLVSPVQDRDLSEGKQRASRSPAFSMKILPQAWQKLAFCESSSTAAKVNLRAVSPSGLHHGVWQIHKGFFTTLGIDWRTASLWDQWRVAQYVYERQGAKAWTCAKKAGLK